MSAQNPVESTDRQQPTSTSSQDGERRKKPWWRTAFGRLGRATIYLILRKPEKNVFTELYEHLICEKTGKDGRDPKRQSEAYLAEVSLLEGMNRVQLSAKIQALRQSLYEMLPRPEFKELMRQISTASSTPKSVVDLHSEAKALLDRVYRRYLLVPKVEQIRSRISWNMLKLVGVCTAVLLVLTMMKIAIEPNQSDPAWVAAVCAVVFGSVGATVSTLIRFQKLDPRRDPLMVWLSLHRDETLQWLSPFLGALFGLIFLLIMRSGMLTGSLFPEFNAERWHAGWAAAVSNRCAQDDACSEMFRDFARLMVWCFAAGWVERLVPDVLNRLADHARSQVEISVKSAE